MGTADRSKTVATLTSQDIIDIFGGGAPRQDRAADHEQQPPAPCGSNCPPEGCWSEHCRVGQPSEPE